MTDSVNIERLVDEYLARFPFVVNISKESVDWHYDEDKSVLAWAKEHSGREHRDWFCWAGGVRDPLARFYFIDQGRRDWFRIMWSEHVVDFPDQL